MKKLPLLDKNAYLALYLSKELIYAALPYSHYEVGRKYVLTDTSDINLSADPIGSREFWMEYFYALEEKFGWDIIGGSSARYGLGRVLPFVDEGEGVAGVQFIISEQISERGAIVAALRECIPEIEIKVSDRNGFTDSLWKIASRAGYKDLLYLDLNLKRFDIYRASEKDVEKAATIVSDKSQKVPLGYTLDNAKISWDSNEALIDAARDSRLKAFSTVDMDGGQGVNQWANFVLAPTVGSDSKALSDAVRSFISVQLLSLGNNTPQLFKDFGVKGKESLIIVTGDLIESVSEKYLILSILDGLQLRGYFDLVIDSAALSKSLGSKFAQGVNASDFIVSQDQVLKSGTRIFIPEIPGKGSERKVVFDGNITGAGNRAFFGLTPSIAMTKFDANSKKVLFEGKFVKGAYVEGIDEKIEFISEREDLVKSVLIDCRFKPVVYGPDYRSNSNKLDIWFEE